MTFRDRIGRVARHVEAVPVVGAPVARLMRRALAGPRAARRRYRAWRAAAGTFHVTPPPRAITAGPEPPVIADPDRIVAGDGEAPPPPQAFDIELFEALNAEYADRPLVPEPMAYDHDSLASRSLARMENIHRTIDLADRRVLEFGCGHGYEVWYLSHVFGSDAWGVDIVERAPWAILADERTRFVMADLSLEAPFEEASFDRIVSINVFEHVTRPIESLEALYRVLRPGGLAWVSANLYRGPLASHRYRDVHFPWPHLLFGDAVFAEFSRRNGRPAEGAAWVNRLTWEQYEAEIRRIGFVIRRRRFRERPIDEAFYRRFEAELGRYPLADLRRDFFEVILERPRPRRGLRAPRLPGSGSAGAG